MSITFAATKHGCIICLIQETEQPKRNTATGADLGIVNCKVAVRDIRNLSEGLSLAAHLKEVLVVDEEVSLLGVTDVG